MPGLFSVSNITSSGVRTTRRPLLTDPIEKRLAELAHKAAALRDMKVCAHAVMPDHLHLLIASGCGVELSSG
jgi:REP element-mobilizing transposase RayT